MEGPVFIHGLLIVWQLHLSYHNLNLAGSGRIQVRRCGSPQKGWKGFRTWQSTEKGWCDGFVGANRILSGGIEILVKGVASCPPMMGENRGTGVTMECQCSPGVAVVVVVIAALVARLLVGSLVVRNCWSESI